MVNVLFARTILLGGNHRQIDRFWEELVLPGSFILALEHILKLREGVSPVKVYLYGLIVEFGDCLGVLLLLTVNLTPSLPLSWWTSAFTLLCMSLICNL
jgi:hypothetical protein